MLVDHQREKLIQAVIFFARHVRKLGKVKLFKLLYFLDFEHYRDTGRSVTGLHYFAWHMGPVPAALFDELQSPGDDWLGKVAFEEIAASKGNMLRVRALAPFDPSHFSKRELRLLSELANEYKDAKADDMVEATHLENLPWHKVWEEQQRPRAEIPYEYSLRKQDFETLKEFAEEREETVKSLRG